MEVDSCAPGMRARCPRYGRPTLVVSLACLSAGCSLILDFETASDGGGDDVPPINMVTCMAFEPNEDPAECARREALEETGYAVRDCERIATFLPSPGSTSERIQIFYAKVTAADRTARGGGVEDEYIEVVEYPVRALNDDIDKGRLLDAKLLIAGQWLRVKHPQVAINPILSAGLGRSFHFREARAGSLPRVIGYKTGPIDDIMGIDAWINAENTDMQMARFFDKGISASIRYLGAARGTDGAIYEDSIADELRRAVSGQVFVRPGSVLVTGSGTLRKTHQVKKVFHVACVQHQRGGNTFTDINAGADGMSRAFEMAEEINNSLWGSLFDRSARPLRSALVPLIGAGNGGKDPLEVAEKLVPAALKYLERSPDATLREIYFIAFQKSHQDALEKVLGDKSLAERIEPAGGTKTAL